MIRSKLQLDPRATWWRVMTVSLLLLAFAPATLGQDDDIDQAVQQLEAAFKQTTDPYERLRALTQYAPSRQIGQPGNAVVDRFVRNWFEQITAEENDSQRWAEAMALYNEAQALHEQVHDIRTGGTGEIDLDVIMSQVTELGIQAYEADRQAAAAMAGMWQTGRIRHKTAVFNPGRAALRVGESEAVRLYQLAPNLVEPANLPEEGFAGPLIYAGNATPAELAGKQFANAAVLVEFNSSRNWLDAVQLGADVVIVLEPAEGADMHFTQAAMKSVDATLSIPRFFLKRDDLRVALGPDWRARLRDEPRIELQQEPGTWTREEVASDWLFVPGTAEPLNDGTAFEQDTGRQMVLVTAYKDSRSIVPEFSPGAHGAGNLIVMLDLIDRARRQQPTRPTLFIAVNDHANALLGDHMSVFAAFVQADAAHLEVVLTDRELTQQRYIRDLYSEEVNQPFLETFRAATVSVGGRQLERKTPATDALQEMRNRSRDMRNRMDFEIRDHERRMRDGRPALLTPEQIAEYQREMPRLDQITSDSNSMAELFNRFGRRSSYDDLDERLQAQVKTLFEDVVTVASLKVDVMVDDRARLLENLSIRRRLAHLNMRDSDAMPTTDAAAFVASHRPLPLIFGVPLDLSFGTDRVGFFHIDQQWAQTASDVLENDASNRTVRLARYLVQIGEQVATNMNGPNRLVDTIRSAGGLAWQAHLGGRFAFASRALHEIRLPGLTLTSIRDGRPFAYTPSDRFDRINETRFRNVVAYSVELLDAAFSGEELGTTFQLRGNAQPMSAQILITQKDKFTVQVPKLTLPNGLVVLQVANPGTLPNNATRYAEVSAYPVLMTDERGATVVRGATFRNAQALAFGYTPDFRTIFTAMDFGDGEVRMPSTVQANVQQFYVQRTMITSEFVKVDLIGLTAPLTLTPATAVGLLDAAQDSAPRSMSAVGIQVTGGTRTTTIMSQAGAGSLFIEPGTYFKLTGAAGLAINSDVDDPQGVGFAPDVVRLQNLPLISTLDMNLLTRSRFELLDSKGVRDPTGEYFSGRAETAANAALDARDRGANDELILRSEEARGYAMRAYSRALGTINDLIKAVVIFLALVIPFCFFVTKLLSPFTDANRQIAMFGVVFLVMAVLLRFLHPAFEISRTPEVVILAFVILGLAVFVGLIITGRFNASMNQAVEMSQMSESVDASQGRLAGVAFLVGVNNMRRRRIRTTLTCATIVLVTFTMLSVISVGQDVEPSTRRYSTETPYTGILYAREGLNAIDPIQMTKIRTHFEQHGDVVVRAWTERKGKYGEYLPYELRPITARPGAATDALNLRVIVGMEQAELDFLGPLPLIAGRWFSSNSASEVVLSTRAAELMGISPEHVAAGPVPMEVHGRDVRLVGLLDDDDLMATSDLNGVPLLPLLTQARLSGATETADDGTPDAGGALLGTGTEIARPVDVAFAPISFARSFGDATYRTVSLKVFADTPGGAAGTAWSTANSFIQFQDARITVGIGEPVVLEGQDRTIQSGQYALASSSSTEVGGVLKIAIPIILAATIILNTMLGSVMERRREVGIYNAIGLNPGHVMMFFLAESLVFGLVGSVAGYLIGQALSLVVARLDIPLNLNYSSLSVMVVIFLAIATVLLSTIYPAMMAARAAVPSGQRRWSLPQPEGDTIRLKFPFSYDADRVVAICAYLRDYMKQNSEASTGQFLAKVGPVGRVPAVHASDPPTDDDQQQKDHRAYVMLFDIAPAPFDLGVNQQMEVYAYYDSHVRAHMLEVYLTRLSGERGNWVTVNQPFLESLRKRLLGWRSQREEIQSSYYDQGNLLFTDAPELPVVGDKQEQA